MIHSWFSVCFLLFLFVMYEVMVVLGFLNKHLSTHALFTYMRLFNVVFHHGGEFVREETMFYRGGMETLITRQDLDRWSYFEAVGLVLGWNYSKSTYRLWRKIEGVDEGFKHVLLDDDIKVVGTQAMSTKMDEHIYVEHNVSSNCEYVSEPDKV